MRIDFSAIDTDRYWVDENYVEGIGPCVLITPAKGNSDAFHIPDNEVHLRSLLCLSNGEVISAGFPKFYNYTENQAGDALFRVGFNEGRTLFHPKMDGSLIIRFVYNGQIFFRTRGCATLGDFHEPVMSLVRANYPGLLNPDLCPTSSLLMEYTAPTNQIVVRYEEASLTGLAEIIYYSQQNLQIALWGSSVEAQTAVQSVAKRAAEYRSLEDTLEYLTSAVGEEGFVAWTSIHGNYHLVKFKSAWYFRLHALRSDASSHYLRSFVVEKDIYSLNGFKEAMKAEGFDWETVTFLEPGALEMIAKVQAVKDSLFFAKKMYTELGIPGMETRKEKALACKEVEKSFPGVFGVIINLAVGDIEKASRCEKALLLDVTVGSLGK